MKVDFSKVLNDLDGRPIKRPLGDGGTVDWTAGAVAADALLAQSPPNAPTPAVADLAERYALAMKVHVAPADCDVTPAQATMIQEAVARAFPPMLSGQLIQLLNG